MKNLKRNFKKQFTKSFCNKKEIQASVKQAKAELFAMCADLLGGKLTFKYGNRICTAHPADFPRCLTEWSRSSSIDAAIRNIIVSCFFSAETNQGGSGLISCILWSGLHDNHRAVRRFTEISDVDEVINSWSPSGMSNVSVKKLVRLGACGRSVALQEGSHLGTVVKFVSGEEIRGSIDPLFNSRTNVGDLAEEFYGVAIDGIVESVSQLHRILESNVEEKIVVLARGFLPDVANTLAENWSLKRLGVIPFVVSGWGVENFLNLQDAGFECVSSEAGNVITNAKLQKIIEMRVSRDRIIYGEGTNNCGARLIMSFGRDLGDLKGVALDRTKILVALSRFVARSGLSKIKTISGFEIFVPNSSLEVAKIAKDSLNGILQNLGGVIITTNIITTKMGENNDIRKKGL